MAKSGKAKAEADNDAPIEDVVAFQASLDDSVASVRALVDSWIPKELQGGGAGWAKSGPQGAEATRSILNSRLRPARMGAGAEPAQVHLQQAEERKLRDRLLKDASKKQPNGDDASLRPSTNGSTNPADASDDDEEESRASAIKTSSSSKHQAPPVPLASTSSSSSNPAASKIKTSNPFVIPPKSTPAASDTTTTTPAASTSGSPVPPLTKNKRKKEREREKAESAKRAKLEAVRAEEEASALNGTKVDEGDDDEEMAEGDNDSVARKLPRNKVQVPFAPLTSSSEDEGRLGVPTPAEESDEEGGEDGEGTRTPLTAGTGSPDRADGGDKKKKKRRKKKKKGGAAGGVGSQPVLNLGTPASA